MFGDTRPSRARLALLLIQAFALASCITTYRDFPVEAPQPGVVAPKEAPLYYHVKSFLRVALLDPDVPSYYDLLNHSLAETYVVQAFKENPVFPHVMDSFVPPRKGLYCSVEMALKPESTMAKAWPGSLHLSSYAIPPLFVLPTYTGQGGYSLKYSLYVDQELKKVYSYQVTVKAWLWMGLLPFTWGNLFTYSAEDAFRATAARFFIDAQQDGYFPN